MRLGGIASRLAKDLSVLGERALDEARVAAGDDGVFLSVPTLRSWPPSVIYEALRLGLEGALEDRAGVAVELPSRAFDHVLRWLQADGPLHACLELGMGSTGHERCRIELRYGLVRMCRVGDTEPLPPCRALPPGGGGRTAWLDWEFLLDERVESARSLERWKSTPADTTGLLECVDAERVLAAGDLAVRCRQAGDRIWPLGSPGSKKLKEFFRERRVWPSERDRVPIVVAGDRIVWVVGHRIDHHFRLRPETERVLELKARRVGR